MEFSKQISLFRELKTCKLIYSLILMDLQLVNKTTELCQLNKDVNGSICAHFV
jgi:hypothetical protein